MNSILLHNSYLDSNKKLCENAWKYGYNGIETNAPGLNGNLNEIPSQIEELERLKEKYLLSNIILHFPMKLINDDEWDQKDIIYEKMNKSFMLASQRLGVTMFNTMTAGTIIPKGNAYTEYSQNGSIAANETHWERAIEMLKTSSTMAKEYGITLAIETHGCLLHDLPGPTLKLLEKVNADNLKVNLDIPNMALTKNNFLKDEEIAPLIPYTGHVHLKNLRMVIAGGGGFLLESVSSGMIDYKPLVETLNKHSYKGAYSLEFPCKYGDIDKRIKADLEFARKLQL